MIVHVNNREIASIHNHQKGYYSFPSGENFGILENEFEDYEIITSTNSFSSIEFKGKVKSYFRTKFHFSIGNEIESIMADYY